MALTYSMSVEARKGRYGTGQSARREKRNLMGKPGRWQKVKAKSRHSPQTCMSTGKAVSTSKGLEILSS